MSDLPFGLLVCRRCGHNPYWHCGPLGSCIRLHCSCPRANSQLVELEHEADAPPPDRAEADLESGDALAESDPQAA
jgi:hypothetical protein